MSDRITELDFPCPYTTEEKYEMATSGEYGAFEIWGGNGEIQGFRGFRKEYGTTGIYETFKMALEAAFTTYGPKSQENK